MKNIVFIICAMLAVLAFAGTVVADDYDLNDLGLPSSLDHAKAYAWGTTITLESGETIVSASLFLDEIYNNYGTNTLFFNLLDDPSGLTTISDSSWTVSDYFDNHSGAWGAHSDLVNYSLSGSPQDKTYTFSDANLATLNTYASDGSFGLGIDPDCHYYYKDIILSLQTQGGGTGIPEPTTILLVGIGLVGLAGLKRRMK